MQPFNGVRLPHADIRVLRRGHVVRPIDLAHAGIGALGGAGEYAGMPTSTRGCRRMRAQCQRLLAATSTSTRRDDGEVLAAPAKGQWSETGGPTLA